MAEFGLALSKFANKAGANADKVVRKVCFDITKSLMEKTPKDTGRLVNNWFPAVGAPSMQTTADTDKSGRAMMARAAASIKNAPGNVWSISNSLPYAMVAEYGLWGTGPYATQKTTRDGYSVQAPYGMVRITYANVRASLA